MNRVLLFTAATGAALAVVLASPLAYAQTAEVLIEQGLELRRQQRDEEALQRFHDAYQISHSAQALAQVSLAEQALGRFALAELHMQQALAVQSDPWIATRRPQLEQALASIGAELGTIELQGGVPGAEVYVNGELRGTLPDAARIRARAGTAVIEVRAQGYVTVQRSLNVTIGGVLREPIQLIAAQGGQVGVQPYPQQGYAVQPGVQPYQPGYPQQGYQTPTRTVSQPIIPMFIAGIPVFLVPWLLTGVFDQVFANDALGFIPIVGPFILIGTIGYDETGIAVPMLVIDGILQIAGIALIVLGLTLRRNVQVRAQLGDDPEAPTITLLPMAGPEMAGLSASLTHF